MLSAVMRRFQQDGRVMERCCRCLRFAVRCVGGQSAPLLPPMTAQMVEIYGSTQHSCLIYLASVRGCRTRDIRLNTFINATSLEPRHRLRDTYKQTG